MSTPMLIVPDGWRFSSHDNFAKDETVYRLYHKGLSKGFDFAIPNDQAAMQSENDRVLAIQKWIWMITGEKAPTPNPAWQTPAAKAALAKALDQPPTLPHGTAAKPRWTNSAEWTLMQQVAEEEAKPKLPPGITRLIELE